MLIGLSHGAAPLSAVESLQGLLGIGQGPRADQAEMIVARIRLPRILLAAVMGACLAVSGVAMQGLFRNPLADPYLIGVASGAGLGAVAAMALRWPQDLLGHYLVPIGAFAGAFSRTVTAPIERIKLLLQLQQHSLVVVDHHRTNNNKS